MIESPGLIGLEGRKRGSVFDMRKEGEKEGRKS